VGVKEIHFMKFNITEMQRFI